MAQVTERKRSDGGSSFQVKWRERGLWESETFAIGTRAENQRRAQAFRLAVETNGNRWPDGWVKGRGFVEPDPEEVIKPTFRQFAEDYVNQSTTIEPRQRKDYLSKIKILDGLEVAGPGGTYRPFARQIDQIAEADIKRWLSQWDRSPKTKANYHGLISAIFSDALYHGLVARNPCERTSVSRRKIKESSRMVTPITEGQFQLLLSLTDDSDLKDLLVIEVGTGLRMSELAALWVEDVDLTHQTISVVRAWKRLGEDGEDNVPEWLRRRLRDKHASKTHYLGPPKSLRARRTIAVSGPVVDALRRAIEGKSPDDFVFTAPRGGPLHHANFTNRVWKPLVKRAMGVGLPDLHFHDLRHTHASWLISANVPLAAIQHRMGHESIQTTVDIYGHLMAHTDERLLSVLDAALRPKLKAVND